MRSRLVLGVVAALALAGCSWVSLTDGGEAVELVEADETASCEELGRTRARTMAKIGPFSRSKQSVFEEQSRLARNEAARMGGNALVAAGDPDGDAQEFIVYRCPED